MEYPEHEKMAAMRTEIDAVARFLEMLEDGEIKYSGQRLFLAVSDNDYIYGVQPSISDMLAQWSGIDQDKLEKEKRQMLEKQRKLNEQ